MRKFQCPACGEVHDTEHKLCPICGTATAKKPAAPSSLHRKMIDDKCPACAADLHTEKPLCPVCGNRRDTD